MTEEMQELESCPFCKESTPYLNSDKHASSAWVECDICQTLGPRVVSSTIRGAKNHAVLLWNTRPTPPADAMPTEACRHEASDEEKLKKIRELGLPDSALKLVQNDYDQILAFAELLQCPALQSPAPVTDAQGEALETIKRECWKAVEIEQSFDDFAAWLEAYIDGHLKRAALSAPSREVSMLRGQLEGKQCVINQLERREKELMAVIADLGASLNEMLKFCQNRTDPHPYDIWMNAKDTADKHAALIAEAEGEK